MAISKPITRVEQYLAHISGMRVNVPEVPLTREEMYLAAWARKSGIEDTQMKGEPPLTLKDCIGEPFNGLVLYGKSTQVTTTGAQLFEPISDSLNLNGVVITFGKNGEKIVVSGTAVLSQEIQISKPIQMQAGEKYVLTLDEVHYFENIWLQGNGVRFGLSGKNTANKVIITVPDSIAERTDCAMYASTSKGKAYNFTINHLMLNTGSTALPWEPYTGGKPSPSPDYPQEIRNALGNLTVRGKNLYDQTIQWVARGWNGTIRNTQNKVTVTASNGWINASFLSPAKGKTVTFSCTYKQIETTSEDTDRAFSIATTLNGQYPNDNNIVYQTISPNTNETTISATFISNTYIGIFLRVETEGIGLTRTVELTNIQLEYGSKATSYEPYHTPQTLTIPTPNGLPGIPVSSGGNYTDENGQQWICDELDFERGVYRQRIKHVNVVFKKEASSSTHSGYRHMAGDIQNMSREHTECLCNIATHSKNAANGTEGVRASGAYNALVLYYENLTNDNVPANVAYILSDPIETPLSETDIAAYRALTTYKGTTILESECYLKVKYSKLRK